jgi:sensor histidine kinase YesM
VRNFVLVILIFLIKSVYAQDTLDIALNQTFTTRHVLVWVDSTGKKSPGDILKANFRSVESYKFPRLLTSNYKYGFFLKFIIKNSSDKSIPVLLTAGDMLKQQAWLSINGKLNKLGEVSQKLKESERPYKYDYRYIKTEIKSGQTSEIFLKFEDLPSKEFIFNPAVFTLEQEALNRLENVYQDRTAFFINSILYGILFYIFLLAVALYYFTKKTYISYYSGYLLFMLLFHVYGFSNSPFTVTPLNIIPYLKIDLRQNFYVLGTQIFYMLFLRDFMDVKNRGNREQKIFFKIILLIFGIFSVIEVIISMLLKAYDIQFYHSILTEVCVLISSIYLIIRIFYWKNLYVPNLLKAASIVLFVGVILGYLGSTLGISKTTSDLFLFYPNYWFNFAVFAEVMLYSLAIVQEFYRGQTEQIRLQRQYAITELSLLRSQINPHFLFNTLNSIKSFIIQKDTRAATEYLTDFSDLIRTILEKSREHLISLKDEVEFCERYLQIEQKRFDGKFNYHIDRDLNINLQDWNVPAFILQPYLENAIKHGFNSLDREGTIRLSMKILDKNLVINVHDNGIGREAASRQKKSNHNSMGEKLIESRLELISEIYQWNITVSYEDHKNPTGTSVRIEIPELR